jgi:uncharacterized protein (TIGR03435 family)
LNESEYFWTALSAARKTMAAAAIALMGLLTVPVSQAQAPQAQDITGTWQGSLKAGAREERIVFKISLQENHLKAVMYSIDQGGQGRTVSAITRSGSTIRMAVAARGASYQGKLNSDGKTITGAWTQGGRQSLNLARATPETALAIPDPPPPPKPMSADATPKFEVATIKPSESRNTSLQLSPSGLFATAGTSLSILIKFAYDLHRNQIVGGPSWLETERYDVTGKPDKPGRPNLAQLKAMIQTLLEDRFQLTVRRDKRELPVYAITVAKSGAKLVRNDSDPNGLWGGAGIGPRSLSLNNITMAEFATVLQSAGSILDRPAVDQTGLGSARYDVTLKWTPDAPQPGDEPRADNGDAPPDLFTAFQQQLGLKLESAKAPVDVLVIDHAEKPSGN